MGQISCPEKSRKADKNKGYFKDSSKTKIFVSHMKGWEICGLFWYWKKTGERLIKTLLKHLDASKEL